MNALSFRLRLLEPMLVSQAESGEENSAIGLPFVPGSAIRGALVSRYLAESPCSDLAADDAARKLFFDGTVCFLNAYSVKENSRMLPTPMSWFTEKDRAAEKTGNVYDWAIDSQRHLEQPKALRGDFCLVTGAEETIDQDDEFEAFASPEPARVSLYSPPRQVNVHIALEDPNHRDERNQVYRYDALGEGEILAGVIVSEDQQQLDILKKLLDPPELQIGGARLAGYGAVRIEEVQMVTDWQEYHPGQLPDDRSLIITVLSDVILRSPNGQVQCDLNDELARLMDRPDLKYRERYCRYRLVGGFNRKWSLPLVQAWALQAGSVYVYPAGTFDPDKLRKKTVMGIGERRAEGFGRLAVNWHTNAELEWYRPDPEEFTAQTLSSESQELVQKMADRRLRLLLEQKLAEAVNRVTLDNLPQISQLSRVRTVAQQARKSQDIKPILDHLKDLRKVAQTQLEAARVDSVPMLIWIGDRVNKLDAQSAILTITELPEIAGKSAELTADLRLEYTARLIDGVMKKAIKQNQRLRKEGQR